MPAVILVGIYVFGVGLDRFRRCVGRVGGHGRVGSGAAAGGQDKRGQDKGKQAMLFHLVKFLSRKTYYQAGIIVPRRCDRRGPLRSLLISV